MNTDEEPNPCRQQATIKLGIDARAKWFYVARHVDGATPQPVRKMTLDGLLSFVARQQRLAREVYTCGVPAGEEERERAFTRQRQQIVRERQRLRAMGRSLLASHGIHVTGKWWTGGPWKRLLDEAPAWVVERLRTLVRLIEPMEAEEKVMEEGGGGHRPAVGRRFVAPLHRADHRREAGADLPAGGSLKENHEARSLNR